MVKSKKKYAEFVQWMGPILNALRELGGSGKPKEVTGFIAHELKVPQSKLQETLKSGALRFPNQVAFARQYLVWDGLLESPKKGGKFGIWELTKKGLKTKLTHEQSRKIFLKWVGIHSKAKKVKNAEKKTIKSQQETDNVKEIEEEVEEIIESSNYKTELLNVLKTLSPNGFERICQRLLRESGFEQVTVTGKTGDGGIDGEGIYQENSFISSRVLFQCKRYTKKSGAVTASQVRDFRGAMSGRAEKGMILTTGRFTAGAQNEALRVPPIIELIDGESLVDLFEEAGIGLIPKKDYDIDYQYFEKYTN